MRDQIGNQTSKGLNHTPANRKFSFGNTILIKLNMFFDSSHDIMF